MKCDVCGNDQFSLVDETIDDLLNAPDDTLVKCSDCGRVISKEQLLEENQHIIAASLEDLTEEAMDQIQKRLKKVFK
jgi:uncharacterized Zn finger protein